MVQRTTRARPHRQDREFGRFDDAREHETRIPTYGLRDLTSERQ